MEIILRLCSKFVIVWFRGNKCSRFLGSAALLGRGEWDDSGTLESASPTALQIPLLLPQDSRFFCLFPRFSQRKPIMVVHIREKG